MGSNLPQNVTLIGKRNFAEVIERQRERAADIVEAVVVSVKGSEYLVVRDVASSQERTIYNSTGRTFTPGTRVFVGRPSGRDPEFVLAGPAGKREGGSVSVPYRIPTPPTEPVAVDHLAFFFAESALSVSYYAGGDPSGGILASLGEAAASLSSPVLLRGGNVSPYSLAYVADGSIRVWDWQAEADYTYTPSGYVLGGVNYYDGALWWVEAEEVQHGSEGAYRTYFRLRSSACDLTSVATVGSPYEWDNNANGAPGQSLNWSTIESQVATSLGILAVVSWQESETVGTKHLLFSWDGSSSFGGGSSFNSVGCNSVAGSSIGYVVSGLVSPVSVASVEHSIGSEPAAIWLWETGFWCLDSPLDGVVSAYGYISSLCDMYYQENSVDSVGSSPTTSILVNPHPALDGVPKYFYAL